MNEIYHLPAGGIERKYCANPNNCCFTFVSAIIVIFYVAEFLFSMLHVLHVFGDAGYHFEGRTVFSVIYITILSDNVPLGHVER